MRKLAITLMLLGTPILSRAQTPENSWAALNALHAGQRIEIIDTNLKKHSGTFSTVSDEAIQLRECGSDVGIRKENVMRVTLLDKSHRLRNAFLLGGLGAGAGAGIGEQRHRDVPAPLAPSISVGSAEASPLASEQWSVWLEERASEPPYQVIRQFTALSVTERRNDGLSSY